jgi:hypothetical protein
VADVAKARARCKNKECVEISARIGMHTEVLGNPAYRKRTWVPVRIEKDESVSTNQVEATVAGSDRSVREA